VSIRGEVRIWDLDQRQLVRAPLQVSPFAIGLDFSPDGSTLAVPFGLADPNHHGVEVRDRETGEQLAELQTANEVRTVAFAPDGSLLAAGQVDGRVQLWETDGWKEAGTLVDPSGGLVLSVEFSPDGRMIATSSDGGTVALWDVEAREPIGPPLPPLADTWLTARFTPEGRHLFAVNDSGEALRFAVDPAVWRRHACAIAGGGLTPQQWEEIVPEQDYVDACPQP
jgi:WD40 repeat protein